MNIAFAYKNILRDGTLAASTEHPNFPAENILSRWFKQPTRSKYGVASGWGLFRFDATNNKIYFNEGAGNLTATITVGDYDAASAIVEIKTQMDAAGATYNVTYDDATNLFTIAITAGTFKLLLSNQTNAAWTSLGWTTIIDTGLAASHTADSIRIHTEEEWRADLGSAADISFVAIIGHNLSASALIYLEFSNNNFASVVAADTEILTWKAGTIAKFFPAHNHQYVRLRVRDRTNPDLYVQIGLWWCDDYFRPRYGYSKDRSKKPNDPSAISASENGQEATIQRSRYRDGDYYFAAVDPDDVADFDDLIEEVGTSKAFFVCEHPDLADPTPYVFYIRAVSWIYPEHIAYNESTEDDFWTLRLNYKQER